MRQKALSPRHAALRIGVHVETFRRWIREGKVDPDSVHNIGSLEFPYYRIDVDEVERLGGGVRPRRPGYQSPKVTASRSLSL